MDQKAVDILISEVRSGNTSSYEPLVQQYQHMVFTICYKILRNHEEAEEIAQDVFLKAYQKLNSFKGKAKFSTWLYQIAWRTAINAARKSKIKSVHLDELPGTHADESILQELDDKEKKYYLELGLNHLETDERSVMSLFYLNEFSIKEVAEITRLSETNVKVKVHRSRKKLYTILEKLLQNELNSIR